MSRAVACLVLPAFLLGATPHIACLCPNGNFMPFCVAPIFPGAIRCGGEVRSACCCAHGGKNSSAATRLRLPDCRRSVTASISLAGQEQEGDADGAATSLKMAGLGELPGDQSTPRKTMPGCEVSAGPLVDRVISFQRLTI